LGRGEGVGSGTEVIGIGNRRGKKFLKDMGMIGGDRTEKGVVLDIVLDIVLHNRLVV